MSEDYEVLLMKAVDGVLTESERTRFEAMLEADPERRGEYEDMTAIKSTTDGVVARILADAKLEPPRESPGTQRYLGLAMVLILGGLAMVLAWTGYELATDPEVPLAFKIGFGGALLGSGLIVSYLLNVRSKGRDPYTEIDL